MRFAAQFLNFKVFNLKCLFLAEAYHFCATGLELRFKVIARPLRVRDRNVGHFLSYFFWNKIYYFPLILLISIFIVLLIINKYFFIVLLIIINKYFYVYSPIFINKYFLLWSHLFLLISIFMVLLLILFILVVTQIFETVEGATLIIVKKETGSVFATQDPYSWFDLSNFFKLWGFR